MTLLLYRHRFQGHPIDIIIGERYVENPLELETPIMTAVMPSNALNKE
ncbi:MAG TPA: hypothetical protein GXX31_02380 [Methanothermobacter sp.]|nr:hypothetical protein [Methanothermobacter tenebrarum]MDD3453874.1 hypothetical protein [Methanobacteriales archaeon]MDX9692585.1 hypothetical protein [Methanothermobacter sp.]HHW16219.1 hypothetical protein [Methanothermobacter sp.]HOQ19902.1 hypothetical protein [Methanothermobacter sp.]